MIIALTKARPRYRIVVGIGMCQYTFARTEVLIMERQLQQKTRTTPPASPDKGWARVLVKHLHARGLNRPEKEPAASLSGPLAGTAYGVSYYLYGR